MGNLAQGTDIGLIKNSLKKPREEYSYYINGIGHWTSLISAHSRGIANLWGVMERDTHDGGGVVKSGQ